MKKMPSFQKQSFHEVSLKKNVFLKFVKSNFPDLTG